MLFFSRYSNRDYKNYKIYLHIAHAYSYTLHHIPNKVWKGLLLKHLIFTILEAGKRGSANIITADFAAQNNRNHRDKKSEQEIIETKRNHRDKKSQQDIVKTKIGACEFFFYKWPDKIFMWKDCVPRD
jgi:hypothetical protein